MGSESGAASCDGWRDSHPPGVSCPPRLIYPPPPSPVELLFIGWNPPGEAHFWNDPGDPLRRNLTWVFEQLRWLSNRELVEVFRQRSFYLVHAVRCWTKAEFDWQIPKLVETCAHAQLEKDLARLRPKTVCALGKLPHKALYAIWPRAIPKTLDYGDGWCGRVEIGRASCRERV